MVCDELLYKRGQFTVHHDTWDKFAIIVSGGSGEAQQYRVSLKPRRECEYFNIITGKFTFFGEVQIARKNCGTFKIKDKIYIFGGKTSEGTGL